MSIMDFSGKKFLVIGAGISGRAASLALADHGGTVVLNDMKAIDVSEKPWPDLASHGVKLVFGSQETSLLDGMDVVVPSPVISPEIPIMKAAAAKGLPIWSEVEVACRVTDADIIGITGTNGKTTTIDGEPAGPKQRLRACSMVFQDVNYQLFADSVRTEVSFGLTDAEAPDAARVDEVLDGLGLAAYAERHPATLSGGQKQRLAVAACIATGKRLLVFDEPTSGLDLGSMRTVAALVRRLADEGRAVLVVTHDLEFIGQACDKAVRVEAGRIAAEAVVEGDLQAVRELLAKG